MTAINWAYLGLMGTALLLMLGGFAVIARLALWRSRPGIGRITVLALASLKLWVVLVLAYFSWTITRPGSVTRGQRTAFAIGLCLYLIAQSATVLVALLRWWRPPPTARRRGSIPDLGDER